MIHSTKRRLIFGLAALLLLVSASFAAGEGKKPGPQTTVILLSMDGVRWDYPLRDHLSAFADMARTGVHADRLTPEFPSLTFPDHAALATGCFPGKNGIIANAFRDPATGRYFSRSKSASWLLEPPLWVLAERSGIETAVCAWPVSSGPWHSVRPEIYRSYRDDKGDFDTLRWIEELLRKPAAQRPGLIMAWTHGADHPGHEEGPDGPSVHAAMRRENRLLTRLLKAIRSRPSHQRVVLIVVSDHGMSPVAERLRVRDWVAKRHYFPFIATSGPICNIYVKGQKQRTAVGEELARLPAAVMAWPRGALPERFHYTGSGRVGDFVLLARPGATFASYYTKPGSPVVKGMHGYDPRLKDMGGIFYAVGPNIARGKRLKRASMVDVAPTICRLLHIPPPPDADGAALPVSTASKRP
ncbi:MAG: alkaline phosphatase family protein [Acidobacteriota bacterium]|jgi:predicted AlkP superfamily pyrophosphatase or phosphodiesterase